MTMPTRVFRWAGVCGAAAFFADAIRQDAGVNTLL